MEQAYWMGLAGGLMIGTAAAVLLLASGRIMGASGLLGAVVDGSAGARARGENLGFLVGLIAAPWAAMLVLGPQQTQATTNITLLIVAGLSVGLGTRLANGCTSGHGVCGISRLSRRGIVATILYLLAGAATVAVFRHGLRVI